MTYVCINKKMKEPSEYIIYIEKPALWLVPKNTQDDRCDIFEKASNWHCT